MAHPRKTHDPFRWFDSSPEVIRTVVMMYVKYPLSLRNVEDLLAERGIDICHETVRLWWNRFGPMFAAEIRRKRVHKMRAFTHWRWHLDEVYVKINGEMHYLWRAVDHEGEVLESFASKTRDKPAALKFMKKLMKRHGRAKAITNPNADSEPDPNAITHAIADAIARTKPDASAEAITNAVANATLPPMPLPML